MFRTAGKALKNEPPLGHTWERRKARNLMNETKLRAKRGDQSHTEHPAKSRKTDYNPDGGGQAQTLRGSCGGNLKKAARRYL